MNDLLETEIEEVRPVARRKGEFKRRDESKLVAVPVESTDHQVSDARFKVSDFSVKSSPKRIKSSIRTFLIEMKAAPTEKKELDYRV